MWAWLKLKLTPKGDFYVVSVKEIFCKFLYAQWNEWMGKINIVTFHPKHPKWDQTLQFTPQSKRTRMPITFIWEAPPPPPPWEILPAVGNDSQTDQTIKTINLFVARDFQSNIYIYIYICMSNKFFTNLECSTRMIIYIVEIRYFKKKKHYGSLMACIFVLMCFPFD